MRQCHRKVVSGMRVAGAIRPLVNAIQFSAKCTMVLHESLAMIVLMYGSETMIWKERPMIMAVQMDNLMFARYQKNG